MHQCQHLSAVERYLVKAVKSEALSRRRTAVGPGEPQAEAAVLRATPSRQRPRVKVGEHGQRDGGERHKRQERQDEESDDEARVTCDLWEILTCLPYVCEEEICLLWAEILTFSSAETLTSSWEGSASEAGS